MISKKTQSLDIYKLHKLNFKGTPLFYHGSIKIYKIVLTNHTIFIEGRWFLFTFNAMIMPSKLLNSYELAIQYKLFNKLLFTLSKTIEENYLYSYFVTFNMRSNKLSTYQKKIVYHTGFFILEILYTLFNVVKTYKLKNFYFTLYMYKNKLYTAFNKEYNLENNKLSNILSNIFLTRTNGLFLLHKLTLTNFIDILSQKELKWSLLSEEPKKRKLITDSFNKLLKETLYLLYIIFTKKNIINKNDIYFKYFQTLITKKDIETLLTNLKGVKI